MTQTSPKPADHNTNGHNPKSLTSAYIGSHTTPSREKLDANRIESASRPKPSQAPFWKQLRLSWENLSFRSKLTLLLLTAAAVPIFILTQINVTVSDRHSKEALQKLLHTDSLIQDGYFKQLQEFSRKEAARMAAQVKEAAIDLNDPRTVLLHSSELNKLVNNFGEEASFVILTNAQGKTIAQKIQILDQDFSKAPSMPTEKASTQSSYRPIAVTLGLNLGDVSIVKNALANQRPLEGAELLKGEVLARLGLAPQAYITPRPQPIQGLPEPKQPAPEGTYDIEQGKVGLVVMDVHPINVNNQVVGTAIIGTLLNHNYKIVDQLKQQYEIPTATIFAEDFRVSTNVPYFDPKTKALDNTRAIGIRAAREVTNPVLNQGQEYFGPTNIGGVEYMGAYRPLYDHQKELNPIQAKPMGMLALAITKTEVENQLNAQRWMGYSVGVVLLVLLSLVAIPVADTFSRPVRRLSRFARKVGAGEQGVRLATTERQDEIGVLSQELNQMAASIEANLTAERQQAEQAKLLTDTSFNIAQSLNSDDIFNTAVQKIRQFLKTDRMVVYGFNENWQGTVIAESVAEGWPRALGAKIDDPCFADKYVERYRKGRVQPTDNIYAAGLNECHIKQLEQFAVKANLVAPIVQAGQLLGLLIAHHCSGPRAWQQDEIDLFAQLANQVGFALDRVNFLEQQRKAKEKIQQRALELLMEVEPVSSGDLTIRASVTEDEIGTIADSYNATIDSLRKIVIQVQTAAKIVAGTTSNSEVSVQELSKEALRQAEEIAVALDRIQQMSNSIRDVAATAKLAAAAVQQATQTVEAGDAAMNQTVEGILAIRETVAATSMKVKQLGESSQKISKVVSLVGRFAAQTNLLALKASIEAARAGEEGRGFAVLADEVRSLASQSAQATAEIESLVAAIQTETNSVVAAMEAGSEQVVTGTKLVDETRQSLNKIADASAQISALVQAIASTAVVQYEASESVTETMSDVAAIAQHTSNEATVVSASFKELLAVAQQLQASVGQFKVS